MLQQGARLCPACTNTGSSAAVASFQANATAAAHARIGGTGVGLETAARLMLQVCPQSPKHVAPLPGYTHRLEMALWLKPELDPRCCRLWGDRQVRGRSEQAQAGSVC